MTEPSRIPPTSSDGPYYSIPTPLWCVSCSIHWATTAQPLCPSCLDDRAREIGGGR